MPAIAPVGAPTGNYQARQLCNAPADALAKLQSDPATLSIPRFAGMDQDSFVLSEYLPHFQGTES